MARILTGVQSTGTPHLGNLLGAIIPAIKMSNNPNNESFLFIADMHSLTQIKDGATLRENTYSTAATWLAFGLDIPVVTVHHMHAHVMAHFIDEPKPAFPFLCLTVSGGHTQIVLLKSYFDIEILGTTIDDAAGEAFDKSAKLLGLTYPGGPLIDKIGKNGNPEAFTFSKPRIEGLNYSFSGFKTSLLYFLQKQKEENFIENNLSDLCASINKSIVDILLIKFKKAIQETNVKHIALAGGVAANSVLRAEIEILAKKLDVSCYVPDFQYCTDNAGMVAITGWLKYEQGFFSKSNFYPKARLPLLNENL